MGHTWMLPVHYPVGRLGNGLRLRLRTSAELRRSVAAVWYVGSKSGTTSPQNHVLFVSCRSENSFFWIENRISASTSTALLPLATLT